MKSLEVNIPEGLFEYITKLVEKKSFESVESYVVHASQWLAELYGFGEQTEGKSLSNLIVDLIVSNISKEVKPIQQAAKVKEVAEEEVKAAPKAAPKTAPKTADIPNQDLILESFGSSKFMFEDAIFASCQFAALKQGNPPLSKEEFQKSLQKMEEAGILMNIKQGEKLMWKRTD